MSRSIEAQLKGILVGLVEDTERARMRGVAKAAGYTAAEIAEHLIRTGAGPGPLSRSFRAEPVEVSSGVVSAWAASRGSAEVYAGIQNDGGTIRPRVRRNLAIPIKGAGIAKGKWPRHFGKDELKLVVRPGRAPLLVKETGARKVVAKRGERRIYKTWVKAIKPMYVLKRSVRIKPKRYLEATEARVVEPVARIMTKALHDEVK